MKYIAATQLYSIDIKYHIIDKYTQRYYLKQARPAIGYEKLKIGYMSSIIFNFMKNSMNKIYCTYSNKIVKEKNVQMGIKSILNRIVDKGY